MIDSLYVRRESGTTVNIEEITKEIRIPIVMSLTVRMFLALFSRFLDTSIHFNSLVFLEEDLNFS
jgi:hypothetical protein